jgi:hypothetical protein
MIATVPTQEQVDRIAHELKPDVAWIRLQIGKDWSDAPSMTFRVILSDEASHPDRLAEVTGEVTRRLFEDLNLADLDYIPYFRFRSRSEQEALGGREWE